MKIKEVDPFLRSDGKIDWPKYVEACIKEFKGVKEQPAPYRWFYYRMVSHYGLFFNDEKKDNYMYKHLSDRLSRAREKEVMPWNAIIDTEREIVGSTPSYVPVWDWIRFNVENILKLTPITDMRIWQPEYLEVWCEKKTLTDFLSKHITALDIIYVPAHGFSSVTFLKEARDRLNKVREEFPDKPIRLLYAGDWDPSGAGEGGIQETIEKKLKEYGAPKFISNRGDWKLERVLLWPFHIKKYKIPPKLVKKKDTRTPKFVAKHGVNTAELDAVHPSEILKELMESIAKYTDVDIERRRQEWYDAEYEYLKKDLPRQLRLKLDRL